MLSAFKEMLAGPQLGAIVEHLLTISAAHVTLEIRMRSTCKEALSLLVSSLYPRIYAHLFAVCEQEISWMWLTAVYCGCMRLPTTFIVPQLKFSICEAHLHIFNLFYIKFLKKIFE